MNWNELKAGETWRQGIAELIATLLFVFLGAGSVVVTGFLDGAQLTVSRLVAIALAHGLAIMLLVSATAPISGGHINPAITFAAMVTRKISAIKGSIYIVAQLAGGILGALLIAVIFPGTADSALGSHQLSNGIGPGAGLLAEGVLTFALVFVVFATAIDSQGRWALAPVAIGVTVLVDHLVGVPLTGASMNPARSLGPALVSWTWTNHWIYWVGPMGGGVLAALIYDRVFIQPRNEERPKQEVLFRSSNHNDADEEIVLSVHRK